MTDVYLGTVAIEPSRWSAALDPEAPPAALVRVSAWLDAIAEAGFDGIEVWERHLTDASAEEANAVIAHPLRIPVFNSYASLDDPDPSTRAAVASWAHKAGSTGVKFNVGNDPARQGAYAERLREWLDMLPSPIALLCECHHGISIAEVPEVAAAIFDAAGPADRLQAIVHTHEDLDHIRARFDAYGDRISHVHVNFIDFSDLSIPRLRDVRERLASRVDLLTALGFRGTWTIEFTHGARTEHDDPAYLVGQAGDDLRILRELLP